MTIEIPNKKEICRLTQEEFWKLCKESENDPKFLSDLIYIRCADDVETFASLFFAHYCRYAFNDFHHDTFRDYKFGERDVRRASGAPRGFAKSTIKALIKPIHDLCYKLEKFIVIISNTEAQAVQKTKDIQAELISNDFLIFVYGRFLKSKKVGVSDFIGYSGSHSCRFLALGSGAEMRGIRFGDVRPTKIILDDVEHSEKVESEHLREKMKNWFDDVVSKIGDETTNIEIVGTVLHQKSLLKTLLKNPRYQSRTYKAIIEWSQSALWKEWEKIYQNIDNDNRLTDAERFYKENEQELIAGTQVLWPEKEPYYRLMVEIQENGLRSFYKEKQNDPMSDQEKVFDPQNTKFYQATKTGIFIKETNALIPWQLLTPFAAIDPATGQTRATSGKKADFTAIVMGYKDQKGRLFAHDIYMERVSPTVFIGEIFRFCEKYGIAQFGVETNLYRNLLLDNIRDEKIRYERENNVSLGTKFHEIYLTENKEKRIYTLEPKITNGHIIFNEDIKPKFFDQMYDFPKGEHDDGLDCLHMLWGMVTGLYKPQAFNAYR